MIFKSSYKKKSIAVFDPIKKNTMSYADLLEEKNKKIYRGKKSLILILAENSVGFIATYFSYIQNEHTIMILGSQANTEYINDTINLKHILLTSFGYTRGIKFSRHDSISTIHVSHV